MSYFASISLPFADLVASASWSGGDSTSSLFQLTQARFTPSLPPGMSVDFALALIGTLSSRSAVYDFTFSLRFSTPIAKGSRSSGECLDAQEFEIGEGLAMIGTEDGEAMAARHTWLKDSNIKYSPVTDLVDGFELNFDKVPPKEILDFHFIIAYSAVYRYDGSESFAVDVPHRDLVLLSSTAIPTRK